MANITHPAVAIGSGERFHQVPSGKIGAGDVADFPADDQLIQRAQNFIDRGESVEAVKMIDVDIVSAETTQAGFAGLDQVMARRAQIVWSGAHAKSSFRRNENLVTAIGDGFAEN